MAPYYVEQFSQLESYLAAAERQKWSMLDFSEISVINAPDSWYKVLHADNASTGGDILNYFVSIVEYGALQEPCDLDQFDEFLSNLYKLQIRYGGEPYWPKQAIADSLKLIRGGTTSFQISDSKYNHLFANF